MMEIPWGAVLLVEVNFKVAQVRKVIEIAEASLKHELKEFELWLDVEAKRLTKEQQSNFYEHYGDAHCSLADEYPEILRRSLFAISYSLIEHTLIQICKSFKKKKLVSLSLQDPPDFSDLDKATEYLKKKAQIQFPGNTPEWQRICIYRDIRNLIVHNNGRFDGRKRSEIVKKFMQQHKGLIISNSTETGFKLTKNLCDEVLKDTENFFKQLFPEEGYFG